MGQFTLWTNKKGKIMGKNKMRFRERLQGIFMSRGVLHLIVLSAMLFYNLGVSASDLHLYLYPKSVNGNQLTFETWSSAGDITATVMNGYSAPTYTNGKFTWAANTSFGLSFSLPQSMQYTNETIYFQCSSTGEGDGEIMVGGYLETLYSGITQYSREV